MKKHMATAGGTKRTMVRTFCSIEVASHLATLFGEEVTCKFCAARLG